MKKLLLGLVTLITITFGAHATDVKSLKWGDVCSGKMGDAWYASAEAQEIADIVLAVQKNNGGWMKNDQLHKLTANELNTLKNARGEHSCLDNAATTMEMRFLAKVYQGTKVEKYRESFQRALTLIFRAEKKCGGWSQYWPLSGGGSYQDYITFNDDLVTNVMKLLRDVYNNKGDFKDLVDEATRERCMKSFDHTVEMIIRCQVDDNGVKAAWCAQHDTVDFLPTEGRPHELPSISGYESAALLSYLMTIDNPSEELQECIHSAIKWLDEHKIEGKAVEDFTNAKGQSDRRVVDRAGSNMWGRFIQIGGESGKKIYNKLFTKLKNRGKSRSYTYNGKSYTYTEYEIAASSYDPERAYEPIFAIYSNDYAHLFYRFLYNYADSDPYIDSKGCLVYTSLMAGNRASYQYLGSWCQGVIKSEYPAWKRRIESKQQAGDATLYELSAGTCQSSLGSNYYFSNGFVITNEKGKGYAKGTNNTVKFSAGVTYSIQIPAGQQAVKVTFEGYDNYDVDAYLASCAGQTFASTDYLFPAKVSDPVIVSHTLDLASAPVQGNLDFSVGVKQCCLVITLYCTPVTTVGIEHLVTSSSLPAKRFESGRLVIEHGGREYDGVGKATFGGKR